jgi:nitrite reductase (NADH) small subunit
MPEFRAVAKLSDVPEGRGYVTFAEGRQLALFNVGGEIIALDGVCPHKGAPLGAGHCENGHVFCPMHGWEFDIRTGACVEFPEKRAAQFPVRVTGESIEVAL